MSRRRLSSLGIAGILARYTHLIEGMLERSILIGHPSAAS